MSESAAAGIHELGARTSTDAGPKPTLLIPVIVAVSFFMEGLDSTIVNTALPQIAHGFHVPATEVSAAITSYLLSLAVFIPLSGWFADRFGARRVYASAILIFTLGSVLCALSTGTATLVASRIVQGFGGALMVPVGRLILARSFPKHELIRAMSFMIVPGLIGPMLGPVIGGVIATYTSWRWVFLINIPLGLAGIAAALVLLRPMAMPPPASFDLPGFILVALCFALLQIGFDWLSTPGSSALRICAMFLGSAALFTLFALYARVREYPVLDLALFRSRTFAVSVLVGAFARIGIASTPFLLPLLFQIPFHMSPLHSGLLTFATAVGQIAMRMSVERLLRRFGVRRMLIANSAITALLLAGMGMFRASTPDIVILVYLFVFGLLQSAQFSTLAALNFSGLAPAEMSRATSISAVVQRFSMSIGIALAAFVLNLASRGAPLNRSDFIAAFCVMAAIEACAIAGFWRLHAGDGADLTVRNRS